LDAFSQDLESLLKSRQEIQDELDEKKDEALEGEAEGDTVRSFFNSLNSNEGKTLLSVVLGFI